MKIHIAGEVEGKIGGGWSFIEYFKNSIGGNIPIEEADVVLIPGASQVRSGVIDTARQRGQKIVLRVDNSLKPSRNKGMDNSMGKMHYYASVADLVIYQCQWAKDYLDDFLGNPNSEIIYNGVDLDIFKPEGSKLKFGASNTYLYSCASKGESKMWEWAWWRYQQYHRENSDNHLLVTGRLPTEPMQHGLDFFNGENYTYLGMVPTKSMMAEIYRGSDYLMAVYQNDCYSNTYLEALACGLELIDINMTGGTPELLDNWKKGRDFNGLSRMAEDYTRVLEKL